MKPMASESIPAPCPLRKTYKIERMMIVMKLLSLFEPLVLDALPQQIGYQAKRNSDPKPEHVVRAVQVGSTYELSEQVERLKWGFLPTGEVIDRSLGVAETEAAARERLLNRVRARAGGYSDMPTPFIDRTGYKRKV